MASQLTIIAATNYSETASNAVTYAAGFAKAAGAKLILFNAFSLSIHSGNSLISGNEMQKELNKASARLDTLSRETANAFKIEVSSYCSYSFLEDELLSVFDAAGAHLIVMGMAERSLEQELLGNTTTAVIKNISFPVLAVPKNARFKSIKKILYACDALSRSAADRLSSIQQLIEGSGTEVEFFSVNDSIAEIKAVQGINSNVEKDLKDVKYFYKSVRSNAVVNEIKKEIIKYNADILVMVPKKYGFWDSLAHKSKTRIMAAGLEIPLLSLPNY